MAVRPRTLEPIEVLGKLLIVTGVLIVVGGIVALLFARYGVHRLPGNIVIRRGHLAIYVPLGLMVVLSLALTILLDLLSRR